MTTGVSKPLTLFEQLFKDLVFTPALKAGELALETAVPALAFPVLKQVDEYIIEQLAEWVFAQFVLLVDVEAIKLKNTEHQYTFDAAMIQLKIIASVQGIDSQKFSAAKEEAKNALSQFVRYNQPS